MRTDLTDEEHFYLYFITSRPEIYVTARDEQKPSIRSLVDNGLIKITDSICEWYKDAYGEDVHLVRATQDGELLARIYGKR